LTQSNFRETVLPVCGGKSTTRVLPNATASWANQWTRSQ
jgi:hypothetical protein